MDALYFLEQRCYAAPYRFRYDQLVSTLLDRDVAALVAQAEELAPSGMVGALIVRGEHWQGRVTIVSLMIDEPFRGQGLGRRLLDWAERLGRANRARELVVPLEAGNEVGAAFLAACGFADSGEHAPFFPEREAGSLWRRELNEEQAT